MRGSFLRRLGFVAVLTAGVAFAGLFASWPEAGAATGTLRVNSGTAGIGQQARVALSALNVGAPGLGAWTIDVSYDPSIVMLATCQAEQGGICNPNFDEDTARVAGTSVAGLPGDHALAELTFICVAPGVSPVSTRVDVFSDATLGGPQAIAATLQGGSLTCTTGPLAPQPTASPPGSDPETLSGDADCDGDVDAIDAAHVLQFEAGLLDAVVCSANADANHDGRVGPIDAAIILQIGAGLVG